MTLAVVILSPNREVSRKEHSNEIKILSTKELRPVRSILLGATCHVIKHHFIIASAIVRSSFQLCYPDMSLT